jgi:hypothetical protein
MPRYGVIESMRRAVIAYVLATLLAGCGQAADAPNSPSPTSSPTSLTAQPDAATLLERPLKLPAVQSGSICPVTPVASRKVDVTDPRGSGPFYLDGQMPHGAFAWNKTVWVLIDGAHGPVLFRGGRVDGAGSLQFSGSPADPWDKGLTLSSNGGVSATFYQRVIDQGVGDAFYLYPATTGCYALQVDGPSFEDVIVIRAT